MSEIYYGKVRQEVDGKVYWKNTQYSLKPNKAGNGFIMYDCTSPIPIFFYPPRPKEDKAPKEQTYDRDEF